MVQTKDLCRGESEVNFWHFWHIWPPKIITKIDLYIFTSSMVFYICVEVSSDQGYMELGGLKKYQKKYFWHFFDSLIPKKLSQVFSNSQWNDHVYRAYIPMLNLKTKFGSHPSTLAEEDACRICLNVNVGVFMKSSKGITIFFIFHGHNSFFSWPRTVTTSLV